MRRLGLLMILLPMGGWLLDVHHDLCGPQGEAWQQCWAHHQGEHGAPVAEGEQ